MFAEKLVSKNPLNKFRSKDDVIFHLKGGNIFICIFGGVKWNEEVVIDGSVFVYINLKNRINISHPILIKDEVLTYELSDLLEQISDSVRFFSINPWILKQNHIWHPAQKSF